MWLRGVCVYHNALNEGQGRVREADTLVEDREKTTHFPDKALLQTSVFFHYDKMYG